jgi:glyoxylase-like metal-dependent hydrolase (beta-lactamase superfamily II)
MQIRIHDIGNPVLRNYLLETPKGWIAVDSGYSGGFAAYRKKLERLTPLESVKFVFLTHAHNDHTGFLAELLKESGARLVVSERSLPRLAAGTNVIPVGTFYTSRGAFMLSRMTKHAAFPPVIPDGRAVIIKNVQDQPFLEMGLPIRVLGLPGHTADSIGLFLEETGDLLCGDAAANFFLAPARHAILIEDARAFGESWDKMLALKPARVYPSHGNAFIPEDLTKYRYYLDGAKLYSPKK